MQLPKDILAQLLGDRDLISNLSALIRAVTGFVNWLLIIAVVTGTYAGIQEVIAWFK